MKKPSHFKKKLELFKIQNDIALDNLTLNRTRINAFVLKMICNERQMKPKNHHFKTIIMRYSDVLMHHYRDSLIDWL